MSTRYGLSKELVAFVAFGVVMGLGSTAMANIALGTGAGALVGNDLTDLGDNGVEASYAPPNLGGFDAIFFASDEPGFGGGEHAFNVFDNAVGGGNDKWCCGGGFPEIVGARGFALPSGATGHQLTSFTVTSSNDTPNRDPRVWRIEGSRDTTTGLDGTWTTIYDHPTAGSDWTARNQVLQYSPADGDTFLTTQGFTAFRMVTTKTGLTGGAFFALNEIEFFGTPVPVPASVTMGLLGLAACGLGGWVRRRRKAVA